MTDYVKSTNFASKDNLASGNPLKIIKGTEFDTEFNNIAVAVATKADLASPALTGTPTAPTAAAGTNTVQVATTAFVQAALQALYPVGSVYINAAVTTNPATLLGFGTWAEIGAGRVLVGQDTLDTAFDVMGETGGSKDAVTVDHTHTFSGTAAATTTLNGTIVAVSETFATAGSCTGVFTKSTTPNAINTPSSVDISAAGTVTFNGNHSHTVSGTTDSTGSSGTNANLQPYVVVRMWKRTA